MSTATAEAVLATAYASYGRVALVCSFQAESGVLIDMVTRQGIRPEVLTVDTGRLPAETHEVMREYQRRYDFTLRVITPPRAEVDTMVGAHGPDLFRDSVDLRRHCCDVRKVRPLSVALRDYDAWVTGLRRDQSPTRATTPAVAIDHGHGGIVKVAPLVEWTAQDVTDYLARHDVPRHPLYASGYRSIGCAPCTRATRAGEDERAGRWWWEPGSTRECGLHIAAAQEVM